MIHKIEVTTGGWSPELNISVLMKDGEQLVKVEAAFDNSASDAWDRYQNALRAFEQVARATFFPRKVLDEISSNTRRQSGQDTQSSGPLSGGDCRVDDPHCRLGDEGSIVDRRVEG